VAKLKGGEEKVGEWGTKSRGRAALRLGGDVRVGELRLGEGAPLVLIAGPCVLENLHHALFLGGAIREMCAARGVPFVFKASFDKANRTSLGGERGPGLREGLAILAEVRERLGVAVTTDVHLPEQAAPVADVVDLLQIPAFLCRQTDLLVAAAATGRAVNLKKGQFMAPGAMGPAVEKLWQSGAEGVMLTERGTSFGHGDLVVDYRGLPQMRALGVPVCFDATHSVQRPGAEGAHSGGEPAWIAPLAQAAVAVGVDALFLEVHEQPARAPSDARSMLALERLPALLDRLLAIDRAVRASPIGGEGNSAAGGPALG
jgi:2-dehydro-3-deoxyphosphooctonate aldolase (KDO 8-P synthase)